MLSLLMWWVMKIKTLVCVEFWSIEKKSQVFLHPKETSNLLCTLIPEEKGDHRSNFKNSRHMRA